MNLFTLAHAIIAIETIMIMTYVIVEVIRSWINDD